MIETKEQIIIKALELDKELSAIDNLQEISADRCQQADDAHEHAMMNREDDDESISDDVRNEKINADEEWDDLREDSDRILKARLKAYGQIS